MRLDEHFVLRKFADIYYLFPTGQKIADYKQSLELNESSGYLLELLCEEIEFDDIVKKFTEKYHLTKEDLPGLKKDLNELVDWLIESGYVIDKSDYSDMNTVKSGGADICNLKCVNVEANCKKAKCEITSGSENEIKNKRNVFENCYKTGPLFVVYNGPKELLHKNWQKFKFEESVTSSDKIQQFTLINAVPKEHLNGVVILRNREVIIMDTPQFYVMLFPETADIHELHISKDGQQALCYYAYSEDTAELKEKIFMAMRFAFVVFAQNNDCYLIHSASVEYNGCAWLFSGKSGEGKSTHTKLWNKYYGSALINGDLNMVGFENEEAVVYGIPWCGTSEIYTEKKYKLGGIIFIKQSAKDFVEKTPSNKSQIMFVQRTISPLWTRQLFEKTADFAEKLTEKTKIYRLYCTENPSAAAKMKEYIDSDM